MNRPTPGPLGRRVDRVLGRATAKKPGRSHPFRPREFTHREREISRRLKTAMRPLVTRRGFTPSLGEREKVRRSSAA